MMYYYKTSKNLLLFITIFTLSLSCKGKRNVSETATDKLEQQLKQAIDSVNQNRTFTFHQLSEALQSATDSNSYYRVRHTQAEAYFYINEFDSVKSISNCILAYCNRQKSSPDIYELQSAACNYLGNYHTQMYNLDSALYYYQKSLDYSLQGKSSIKWPDLYVNIADNYVRKGDFAMGATYFRKALHVSDSIQNSSQMRFPIYFGLGQVYMELRDFDISDTYFRQAEKLYDDRNLSEKFTFCNNRGNYYYYKEDYTQALKWFRKALALLSGGDYKFYVSLCQLNLGDIFLNLNEPDSAHYYLNKSYDYFSTIQNPTALYYIATIRAGLALKENNTALAAQYLDKTKDNTGVEVNIVTIRNKYLQDYYYRTGNYKKAYQYQSENIALNDSIRTDRALKRAFELDMRYKQDTTLMKKELIISEQATQVSKLQISFLIWAAGFTILLLLALFVYYHMKKQRDIQKLTFTNDITKLRMENIRNRISPHFLLNMLNHEIQSAEQASRSKLYLLVDLLRKSLEMTDQSCISLKEEIDFVETYIQLEKESLGQHFSYNLSIDPTLHPEKIELPPMMVQIPVENAIKHALRPKEGEKQLTITVEPHGNGIIIKIEDNGTGYAPMENSTTRGTGTGTKVLCQTIDLLNRKNKEKIDFSINSKQLPAESGTIVTIYIPDNFAFQ
nr:tetratricopeptide repeat protein [uncultured Macellibacteroides sp.]